MIPPVLHQYLRYTVIAAVGISIHASIMFTSTEWLGVPYMISFVFGLPASHSVKFTLDKFWTFKPAKQNSPPPMLADD